MTEKKVILDLDTGVDDALALAYAIANPTIDLIGVISSYGNNTQVQTTENSLKLIDLFKEDIPVYPGANHPSGVDDFQVMPVSKQIHGDNGIANLTLPIPTHSPAPLAGSDFLIQAVHQYGKNLTYIPTGPLTNLAIALKKDPEIANLIGHITLMGGALTIEGNVTEAAEANIYQDPEAANIVFTAGFPLTMVGLDVTLRTLLTKKETAKWRRLGSRASKFYADLTDFYIDAYADLDIDKQGCALHDPLAVGVAIDPTFISTISLPMKVVTKGDNYGRTIGDKSRLMNKTDVAQVATNVDAERFLNSFMDEMTNFLVNF